LYHNASALVNCSQLLQWSIFVTVLSQKPTFHRLKNVV
jgi:hypothetical protein